MKNRSENAVAKIVARYCEDFPGQVRSLIEFLEDRQEGDRAYDVLRDTRAELHRMAGAAHCLGFRQVGAELSDLERTLQDIASQSDRAMEREIPKIKLRIEGLLNFQSLLLPQKSRLLSKVSNSSEADSLCSDDRSRSAVEDARSRMMSKERFLIAEDDPYIRDMMKTTLMDMGVEDIKVAASGFEVLKVINEFEPTFIISDWEMEPVSGLELLKCIRRGGTNLPSDTPIVFFTAHKDRQSTLLANRNGVNKLVGKPVLPAQLRDAVLGVVEKRFQLKRRATRAA
ncbi:MAG: hypothetical protein CMK07_03060 [Ponticaulis sp.]|nr:hypothetical protein [Ponticaulis sp.]